MSQRYIGGLIYNPPGGFSGYFDGSGDYLVAPDNAALEPGSSDLTWEMWINTTNSTQYATLYSRTTNIFSTGMWSLMMNYASSTTGDVALFVGDYSAGSPLMQTSGANVRDGAWHHIAVVRNGSAWTIYVDGVSRATQTWSGTIADISGGPYIGRDQYYGRDYTGYISNLRVLKGTALYTSAFTPPNGPLQAITNTSLLTCAYGTFRDGSTNNFTITVNGNTAVSTQNPFPLTTLPNPALGNAGNGIYSMSQYQALKQQNLWPAIDPYFDFVTLMLHGNGTNGAQNNTFLDSSTNNFTITRNGNTTQGTFTPYGSNWSNYFDGTGDSLTVASNSVLNGSAFTLEGWFYYTAAGVANTVLCSSTGSGGIALGYASGTSWGLAASSVAYRLTTTTLPTVNAWNHIVVARSGTGTNQTSIFLNGNRVANGTVTDSFSVTATFIIGWDGNVSNNYFNGYISNLRFVNSDVYGASNTSIPIPAAPLTAITNTSLLTCQSNRFIDNSSNAFTITRNGDVSVQRFSPFNPITPYSAATVGGSGYFDGSGDYLNGPSTGQFAPTGDFTISMWFYPTSFAASYYVLAGSWNAGASDEWLIQYDNTGAIRFLTTTDSTFSASGVVKLNQWQFLTISRSGSTVTGYINGTSFRSYTLTGTVGSATKVVYIGSQQGTTWPYAGYMTDYRLVSGSAQSATPPTSPATAISGTNTLLNFTNGGIIDNAMMNDLETVGNAQISTSVSKFGGGSMAFDGTGDWLNIRTTSDVTFGSGDFTFEGWLYLNSVSGAQIIFDQRPASTQGVYPVLYMNAAVMTWYISTTATITSSSLSTGVWYHFAVCRSSGSTKMFINGTQTGSTYTDSNNYLASRTYIGISAFDQTGGLNGYIDDLRITKGYARYTANFTPQRSQWQDQ